MRIFLAGLVSIAFGIISAAPAAAQQYNWTNDAPSSIKGKWVEMGEKCEDENSHLVIFSDGGYRWRKSRTDWGFARGKYSYGSIHASSIYFRLQRFLQKDDPDFQISVSGAELKKYSHGSSRLVRYEKCRD